MFDPKQGGAHLGAVRSWIQRKAINGETCIWGSNDILKFRQNITPKLLEDLARDIASAVVRELITVEHIQEKWEEQGRPEIHLDVKPYSVKVSYGDEENEYLDLNCALRSLYHKLRGK